MVTLTTDALSGLNQAVMTWTTYSGSPNLSVLPLGVWKVYFKCALQSAGETVDFYFKLYKQGPAPTFTTVLLGTSTVSGTLTTSQNLYTVTILIASGTIANSDTLSLVLYTNVHTGGTANIVFQVEGDAFVS